MPAIPFPLPAPGPATAPGHHTLLVELLALNEEMIRQLEVERRSATGTPDFLTAMIDQHARVAALLRSQLGPDADIVSFPPSLS